MEVSFDPEKRRRTLERRGLDFLKAAYVFAGVNATREDVRVDYGERRFITLGDLEGRPVIPVWTPTGGGRRIISMRYAHAEEVRAWRSRVG